MQKVFDNEGERVVLLTDVDDSVLDIFALVGTKVGKQFDEDVAEEIMEILADVPFLAEIVNDAEIDDPKHDVELTIDEWVSELVVYGLSVLNDVE